MNDSDAVQRYAADELVASTTTTPWPYPADGGIAFVKECLEARKLGRSFSFAIVANNELVGVVGINGVDHERRAARCDYAIASSHWGRGITTKALAQALCFAFDELGLQSVNSASLVRNPGSSRVLEKNGFAEAGQFVFSDSKFKEEPARRFRLTRQDWLEATRPFETMHTDR